MPEALERLNIQGQIQLFLDAKLKLCGSNKEIDVADVYFPHKRVLLLLSFMK